MDRSCLFPLAVLLHSRWSDGAGRGTALQAREATRSYTVRHTHARMP